MPLQTSKEGRRQKSGNSVKRSLPQATLRSMHKPSCWDYRAAPPGRFCAATTKAPGCLRESSIVSSRHRNFRLAFARKSLNISRQKQPAFTVTADRNDKGLSVDWQANLLPVASGAPECRSQETPFQQSSRGGLAIPPAHWAMRERWFDGPSPALLPDLSPSAAPIRHDCRRFSRG